MSEPLDPSEIIFSQPEPKPAAPTSGGALNPSELSWSGTAPGFVSPLDAVVGSGFADMRSGGRQHRSGDLAAPAGTPVVAPGNMEFIAGKQGGANLRDNDWWAHFKDTETGHTYKFAHIGDISHLKPGQIVKRGEEWTSVGGVVDGPHLHMSVLNPQGEHVDWLKEADLSRGNKVMRGKGLSARSGLPENLAVAAGHGGEIMDRDYVPTAASKPGSRVPVAPAPAPAPWQEIQEPMAASVASMYQHPEGMDAFSRGFGEGFGWGLVPKLGQDKASFLPASMYDFGRFTGALAPMALSFAVAGPAAITIAGGIGPATTLGAVGLTPFLHTVMGGAIYGAGERFNEIVRDSTTGNPTPDTMKGWGQIMGSAYNNALGFALADFGFKATIGELANYISVRGMRKAFAEPSSTEAWTTKVKTALIQAYRKFAGGDISAEEAAEGISKLAKEGPGALDQLKVTPQATAAIDELNAVARDQFDVEMGDALNVWMSRPGAPGEPPVPALQKRVTDNLAQAEMADRVAAGVVPAEVLVEAAPPVPEVAPTAHAIQGSFDQQLIAEAAKVEPSNMADIHLAQAVQEKFNLPFAEAEAKIEEAVKNGVLRIEDLKDGTSRYVPGPKFKPVEVVVPTEMPGVLSPKVVKQPDGTTKTQAGIYMDPGSGVSHEFHVVEDPLVEGGFRFVEQRFKGDVPLSGENTLLSGSLPDIHRFMSNTSHMKWQNAHKFLGGDTVPMYSGIPTDALLDHFRNLAPIRQKELLSNFTKDLYMSLAPEAYSKEGGLAAQGLREYHARLSTGVSQREIAWKTYRNNFEKMTPDERTAWINGPLKEYQTTGTVTDRAYEPMFKAVKKATNEMVAAIEGTTGKDFPYREFYFRQMWKDDPVIIKSAVDMYEAQMKNGYYDPDEIKALTDSIRSGQPAPTAEAIHTMTANRTLQGPKTFLKPRKIPTMADGVSWGLTPGFDNPVDIVLKDLMDKHKYVLGQKFFKQLKERELVKYDAVTEIPRDWQPIDDSIAKVWQHVDRPGGFMVPEAAQEGTIPLGGGPERMGYVEVPRVKGMIYRGKYWAPQEVAEIINRDLQPGLRDKMLYRIYQTPTQMLNQIQVAWSGFHWIFETLSDIAIGSGRGLVDMASGIVKGDMRKAARGLKDFAINTPFGLPYKITDNLYLGNRLNKALMEPETASPQMTELADMALRSGARGNENLKLRQALGSALDETWTALKGFKTLNPLKLLVGQPAKAALGLSHTVSAALMDYYVPRVKLAAWSRLLSGEFEQAAAKLGRPLTEVEQSLAAMGTWQHIDNIFGQLVYENIHLSKSFRDMAFGIIRFPGWNIGSARTIAGLARGVGKTLTGRALDQQAQVAMEYTAGMAINLGIMGTLTNYGLTGYENYKRTGEFRGEFPQTLQDVYMPKTGKLLADGLTPERIWFPSYFRDLMGTIISPVKKAVEGDAIGGVSLAAAHIGHKLAPGIRLTYELLTNKDFFNRQIYTPDASVGQKAGELGKHLATEYIQPFSFQQVGQARSTPSAVANVAGITNVPRRYLSSPAQAKMTEYFDLKRGTLTKTEAMKSDLRHDMIAALREGNTIEFRENAKKAVAAKLMDMSALSDLVDDARKNPLTHSFKQLPLEWALKTFQLASPDERKVMGPLLIKKMSNAPMVEKARIIDLIKETFNKPKTDGG